MVIDVPPQIEQRLTPELIALNFALGLYASEEVTLEQGACIAMLSQPEFLKELGRRQIPVHYGAEEFEEDLRTIRRFQPK